MSFEKTLIIWSVSFHGEESVYQSCSTVTVLETAKTVRRINWSFGHCNPFVIMGVVIVGILVIAADLHQRLNVPS